MSSTINLLLAVTGSGSSIKIPEFVKNLRSAFEARHSKSLAIKVVATEYAFKFFEPNDLFDDDHHRTGSLDNGGPVTNAGGKHGGTGTHHHINVYRDADEWTMWNRRGDPVLHIELTEWAHMLVIVPMDANTLAKVAVGMADNLVTCVIRSWDIKSRKPVVVAPVMNQKMWEQPITQRQIKTLSEELHFKFVAPTKDYTFGALADPRQLADMVARESP